MRWGVGDLHPSTINHLAHKVTKAIKSSFILVSYNADEETLNNTIKGCGVICGTLTS